MGGNSAIRERERERLNVTRKRNGANNTDHKNFVIQDFRELLRKQLLRRFKKSTE
jgi:hypothetical protein